MYTQRRYEIINIPRDLCTYQLASSWVCLPIINYCWVETEKQRDPPRLNIVIGSINIIVLFLVGNPGGSPSKIVIDIKMITWHFNPGFHTSSGRVLQKLSIIAKIEFTLLCLRYTDGC